MSASNASLNYNKTKVLSLSCQPQPTWTAFLATQNITTWHDRDSLAPLTYLGFAIHSSSRQRTHLVQSLFEEIQLLCQLHAQHNLSMRGRITVLNTLILSKLWHVLRLFTFNQKEFYTIQQICAAFVNRNAKTTRFSFHALTQPRSKGDIGLLDPKLQAHALQWRWLHPQQPTFRLLPALPILRFTLNVFLNSSRFPSFLWSLLFPRCRPSTVPTTGPVTNILRSVDSIRRQLHFCHTTHLRKSPTPTFISSAGLASSNTSTSEYFSPAFYYSSALPHH